MMSRQVTSRPEVEVLYQPSVDGLMTDWLAERVERGISITIDAAPACGVEVERVYVSGVEFVEEPTRWIMISPHVVGSDDQAYEYWGVLAEAFVRLNEPPPPSADNADVTVQVSVHWDV
jgi:hypothetical protein